VKPLSTNPHFSHNFVARRVRSVAPAPGRVARRATRRHGQRAEVRNGSSTVTKRNEVDAALSRAAVGLTGGLARRGAGKRAWRFSARSTFRLSWLRAGIPVQVLPCCRAATDPSLLPDLEETATNRCYAGTINPAATSHCRASYVQKEICERSLSQAAFARDTPPG
jgi:hypothetical protein